LYNLQHLVEGDRAVFVDIVQLECPWKGSKTTRSDPMYQVQAKRTLKLLIKCAATGDTQCRNELLEIDSPVLVFIEHVEHIICKLCGIAKGKKLLIYPRELCPIQSTRWTILAESLVPEKE